MLSEHQLPNETEIARFPDARMLLWNFFDCSITPIGIEKKPFAGNIMAWVCSVLTGQEANKQLVLAKKAKS
jgi:hypothetical protein